MDLSNLRPADGSNRVIISEGAVVMVPGNGKTAERAIKDRRLVQELQDLVSKAVRCLYTEEFLREVSFYRNSKTIRGINLDVLERFEDGATVSVDTLICAGIVKSERWR